ncbi:hypothetical protein ASG11_12445 [Sphingomonas sp. Leaf357]|uniref:TonB-dependent receptor n=1 Tax=Sphingomonas sp. Leaf357 TaxID=1736350 RepID=UPI0006F9F7CD|nr:TonB-dependent receptor [Sphingomonas sp. Leaf357]KQS04960.1 hypothetical protein ASG11_12445 [Sphingomonas sp. Leaf357]
MSGFQYFTKRALLTGAAFVALLPVAAVAQDATAAQATPTSDTSDTAEIVVTAQKRSERLQDVPASVSVVSATDLTKQGVVRFSDYATRVPGLSLTSVRTGQSQVTLRGITTGAAQSASSTGYYIDEAPIGSVNAYTGGSTTTPDLDPSDLSQIEVLKGPQGTLYGAGAVGGLLKFATTSPSFTDLGGRVSGNVTNVAHGGTGYAGRGVINVPLVTDQLTFHVSGFYRRDAGYIDNVNARIGRKDVNRATVRGGRAVLAMKLGPDVRLDLSAIGQDTTTRGLNTVDVDAVTLQPLFGRLTQNRNVVEGSFIKFRLYNATLRADLGAIDLVSSTTYQHTALSQVNDATRSFGALLGGLFGIPTLGVRSTQNTRTERWSEELRANANGVANGLLDLQAGFYWTHEQDSNRIPSFDPFLTTTGATVALPNIVTAAILSKYEEYSLFGNATVHLGDKFDILGGVRYSHDKQDYFQDYAGLIIGARRINTGQEKANIATYLVSPRFKFSENAMVYGRVASGYRPGGPNAVPPPSVFVAPDTFAPDRLTQYEIGFKGQTADRSLSIDAALFYTNWKDIQIQTSAAGFNFFVNGGKARSQGAEATLRYRPVAGLNFGLNAGYTDAKLITAAPAAGGVDGDRLPYVPRLAGSFTADYDIPLSGTMKANIGGSANYVGNRNSDYSQKFPKRLNDYTTFDLRAGVGDGAWSLSAFARNLTDKRAINVVSAAGLAPSNTAGQVYNASYIQPRTIGLEAAFRF